MTVREEALRVDDQLAVAAHNGDRLNGLGCLFGQPATGSNHGDAHRPCLWLQQVALGNGC